MSSTLELERSLYGSFRTAGLDHDVVAAALNERFVEPGHPRQIPYSSEVAAGTGAPR